MQFKTEDGPQGWVPLMVVRPTTSEKVELPAVVLLHPTGGDYEAWLVI